MGERTVSYECVNDNDRRKKNCQSIAQQTIMAVRDLTRIYVGRSSLDQHGPMDYPVRSERIDAPDIAEYSCTRYLVDLLQN